MLCEHSEEPSMDHNALHTARKLAAEAGDTDARAFLVMFESWQRHQLASKAMPEEAT